MIIQSDQQLNKYREAGKLSTEIMWQLHQFTKLGVTPLEINNLAEKLCQENGVKPSFKGVGADPYQYATCISVNDTIVHGIPQDEPLKDGDLVKVDFGLIYDGLLTDHCFTVGVGKLSTEDNKILQAGRESVLKAAKQAKPGKYTGDLGNIMEGIAKQHGFVVTRQYVGHGIGTTLHEKPQLPAWGEPGTGVPLKKGMVLCVEDQLIAGSNELYTTDDGWSVKTKDGSKTVMFEFMVVVDKEPIILTPTMDWPLTV